MTPRFQPQIGVGYALALLATLNLLPVDSYAVTPATTAEIKKSQAISELQQGNYPQALELLQQSLKLLPNDAAVSYYLGLTLSNLGRYAEAEPHLKQALTDPQVKPRAQYELGYLNYRTQNWAVAAELFQQILTVEPNHLRAHYYRALALQGLKRGAEALPHLEQVVASGKSQAASAAYIRLGILYEQQQYEAVRAAAERYPKEFPNSPYQPQVEILGDKAAARVERNRPWSLAATAGLSYDTNVPVLPDDIPPNTSSDTHDWRLSLGADGRYTLFNQEPHRIRAGLKLSGSSHQQLTDYNTRRLGLVGDYRYQQGSRIGGVEYNLAQSWLGGRDYMKNQSISPYYSFKPVANQMGLVQLSWSQNDYLPEANLDSHDGQSHYLAYSHTFLLEGQRSWTLAGHLINNSAQKEEFDYQGGGVGGSIRVPYRQIVFTSSLNFSRKNYPNDRFERQDDTLGLTLQASYPLLKNLYLDGQFIHTDNNSNLASYTYQRDIISANLRWNP